MRTVNFGVLAHVDAGKTTLTERLLYSAGVIDSVGSVDAGTTRTDTLALERQRGITIRAAVVAFRVGDVLVNLIDTPGHPDFIAEVDRAFAVLDGAVLVISAVEGIQPQTRRLMRVLQRLGVPTLLFVNKIDRRGARYDDLLVEIGELVGRPVQPMGVPCRLGSPAADVVPRPVPDGLAGLTRRGQLYPVFFGSALTGAGVDRLRVAIADLLPATDGDGRGDPSALVFKVERSAGGHKVAYARMFSGTLRVRQQICFGPNGDGRSGKITAIEVFSEGTATPRGDVGAGEIAKLWGLRDVQVGDAIGAPPKQLTGQFPPPTLKAVVVPTDQRQGAALSLALAQLAEQDPLINVHQDEAGNADTVSIYGEIQKQVLAATLASEYGIDVLFRETTTICIERPRRSGYAVELLQSDSHPFSATVGLRIDPAPLGSGVAFRLDIDPNRIPIFIYKTQKKFREAMTEYVSEAFKAGLRGWEVTDAVVTMTDCDYYIGDGATKATLPTARTTAADFRKLTPIVLREALRTAGTVVCQPMLRVNVETPVDTIGEVFSAAARLGGAVEAQSNRGRLSVIDVLLPAARAQELIAQLPGLTGGEAVTDPSFAGYQPVRGTPPAAAV